MVMDGEDLTELCCAEILLEDSYGNGWDGASLQAFMNGDLIAEFTLEDDGSDSRRWKRKAKHSAFLMKVRSDMAIYIRKLG